MEYLRDFISHDKLQSSLHSTDIIQIYRAVKVIVEVGLSSPNLDHFIDIPPDIPIHDILTTGECVNELTYLLRHAKIRPNCIYSILGVLKERMCNDQISVYDMELLLAGLHQTKEDVVFDSLSDDIFDCLIKQDLFANHQNYKPILYHSLLPFFLTPHNLKRLQQILVLNRLDVICALHRFFILDGVELPALWALVQNGLRTQEYRKSALFLLKYRLANPVRDGSVFFDTEPKQYDNLVQLLETSDAKQLHLLQPSLHLLQEVDDLHSSWQLTVWSVYLTHAHPAVVEEALSYLLRQSWWQEKDLFAVMIPLVLRAFNQCYLMNVFGDLEELLQWLDDSHFRILIKVSAETVWIPAAFYYFHKTFLPYVTMDSESIINILNRLEVLPDKNVRDQFMELHLKNKILQFIAYDKNAERTVKDVLYMTFMHYYKRDDVKKFKSTFLIPIQNCLKESYNISSIFEVSGVTYTYLLFLKTIQVYKEFKSEYENVLDTFLRDVYTEEAIKLFDLENLRSIKLKYDTYDYKLTVYKKKLIPLEDIVMNTNIAFDIRSIALQIYATLLQPVNESVASLWIDTFILGNYKFDESTCRALFNIFDFRVDEDVGRKFLNKILTTQTDSVVTAFFGYLDSEDVGDLSVLDLKQCCKKLGDMKKSRCFKKACNLFFENLSDSATLNLIEIEYFRTLFRDSVHVRYLITNKWLLIVQKNVHIMENINIMKLLFENCLLVNTVRTKKEKIDFNIMMELQQHGAEYEDILREWYCYKSQMTVFNTILICVHFKYKDILEICNSYLEKLYQKRYYADSQIHIEKIRIYQLLIVTWRNSEDWSIDFEKYFNIFSKYNLEASNQTDVKQMQWIHLLLLFKGRKFEIKNLKLSPAYSNYIPLLYHLTCLNDKYGELNYNQTISSLYPLTMGANFKQRLCAQQAIIYVLELAATKGWTSLVKTYQPLQDALKTVLGTSCNDTSVSSDSHYMTNFLLDSKLSTSLCAILFDIPQENNLCEQEWKLYTDFIKNMPKVYVELSNTLYSEKLKEAMPISNRVKTSTPVKKTHDNSDAADSSPNLVQRKPTATLHRSVGPDNDFDGSAPPKGSGRLVVAASLVDSAANLGGLARTCHILGAATLVLHDAGATKTADFRSLSMSAERWLDIQEIKASKLGAYLLQMRKEGYSIIGAEQTNHSVLLGNHSFQEKTLLLLGNERTGIPADLLTMLDICVEIPQYGVVRSLNVHVAAALFVYEYSKTLDNTAKK